MLDPDVGHPGVSGGNRNRHGDDQFAARSRASILLFEIIFGRYLSPALRPGNIYGPVQSEQKSGEVILWIALCEISTDRRPVPKLGIANGSRGFGEGWKFFADQTACRYFIKSRHRADSECTVLALNSLQRSDSSQVYQDGVV